MAYSVELYYNTGFNIENAPDSLAVLNLATKKVFDSVILRQNNDLTQVKLAAEYNEVKNADYAKIGDVGYIVTNVEMVADKTATLSLTLDSIATIGVNNVTILDGWCKRRIIPLSQQDLNSYAGDVLPEQWKPQHELQLDIIDDIKPSNSNDELKLAVCTADLKWESLVANAYEDSEGESVVYVPDVPSLATSKLTTVIMYDSNASTVGLYTLPSARIYSTSIDTVLENLNKLRSLGIESAIISSYCVPGCWNGVTSPGDDGGYDRLSNAFDKYNTGLNYKYYSGIENVKVFALYNDFVLYSIASGNNTQYSFSQVYSQGDSEFTVVLWADISPNGCPFCRPESYYGNTSNIWTGYVKGAEWQNNEIKFDKGSGWQISAATHRREDYYNALNLGSKLLNFGSMVDNPLSYLSGLTASAFNERQRYTSQDMQWQEQNIIVAPELKFPYSPSIQSFVGNGFSVGRYRLTENDAKRFDTWLHRYGEAVDEKFTSGMFHVKQQYDFLQVSNMNIKSDWGIRYNIDFCNRFANGVRIWHTLPNQAAMEVGGNADA